MTNRNKILTSCLAGFFLAAFLLSSNSLVAESSDTPAPRTSEEEQVIAAYKKVSKAVVNINTSVTSFDFFGPNFEEGTGSGVVIDKSEALVLTNSHVISDGRGGLSERISVTLGDGQTLTAKIVGVDLDNDIALLKIVSPPDDLVAAALGDSKMLEVGQRVLAIGNPFGLNQTLTTGIISSLGRTIRSSTDRLIEDIIQTDAAINPGNSGGPLLDAAGRIVGINTAIVSQTGENAGIGFAVPVSNIKKIIPQLKKYGRVLRPRLGVIISDTDFGPVLLYVKPGSPADSAGLKAARKRELRSRYAGYVIDISQADFIIEINGKRVVRKSEIVDILSSIEEPEKIDLTVQTGFDKNSRRRVSLVPELG